MKGNLQYAAARLSGWPRERRNYVMVSKSEEIDYRRRRLLSMAAVTIAAAPLSMPALADAHPRESTNVRLRVSKSDPADTGVTVVLVHGAWADGTSWARVITRLQSKGLKTMAAPIPLTSLSNDVAALDAALERTTGPVVLAAHAYAGAVIAACHNERVRSLVFIAALTPDEGETVADVFYREKASPQAPHLVPDEHGLLWMPDDRFGSAFCQHASTEEAALLAATQRPIAVACIQEKAPTPAWKTTPSWYLVAEEDRMINPATELFLARRMGAQIQSRKVDHAPLVTAPELVVGMILDAVTGANDPHMEKSGKRQPG
jgi:pimeloyl-ACP methyl ester carboxylesterase